MTDDADAAVTVHHPSRSGGYAYDDADAMMGKNRIL